MYTGKKNSISLMEKQLQAEEDDKDAGGMLSVHAVTTRFKENTTAHGIPHVHNADGIVKTIFWVIISLAATAGFGYNAYLLIGDYVAFNTTTSVTIEAERAVTLPAITFCNHNAIIESKLQSESTLLAIQQAYQGRRKKRDTQAVSHTREKRSTEASRDSQVQFQSDIMDTVADFAVAKKMDMGHQLDDLIVECTYNGYSCNITSDFYQFYDAKYGNCFAYNWGRDGETLITSYRPGATHGLSIVFNTYQDEYVGYLTEAAGMRVSIHEQTEMPFPADDGLSCSPGMLTNIGMKKVTIARMGSPYGDCTASSTSDISTNVYTEIFGLTYTKKACQVTCYQKNVISRCGCGDPSYPLSGTAFGSGVASACKSSNTTQDTCKLAVLSLWNNDLLHCTCLNPCNQDAYETSVSVSMWPSDKYKLNLFGQLPNTPMLQDLSQSNDTDEYKRNLGKINIYFMEFNYELVQEDVAYELFSLLSDMGGILGLYIGFSLMTILEFFELAVDLIVVACVRERSKKQRQVNPKMQFPDRYNGGNGDGKMTPVG